MSSNFSQLIYNFILYRRKKERLVTYNESIIFHLPFTYFLIFLPSLFYLAWCPSTLSYPFVPFFSLASPCLLQPIDGAHPRTEASLRPCRPAPPLPSFFLAVSGSRCSTAPGSLARVAEVWTLGSTCAGSRVVLVTSDAKTGRSRGELVFSASLA